MMTGTSIRSNFSILLSFLFGVTAVAAGAAGTTGVAGTADVVGATGLGVLLAIFFFVFYLSFYPLVAATPIAPSPKATNFAPGGMPSILRVL